MAIFLAWLIDFTLGEPTARLHPVVWMGGHTNTANAMWGYRTPELGRFGKVTAHADICST